MIKPRRIALLGVTALVVLASTAVAASPRVTPARGATRASLRHTFIVKDGSSQGISGEYVTHGRPTFGVVCQRTPDGRLARFVFTRSRRSWRFVLTTTGTRRGNSSERALERACH
jgi:hypothetical protein